MSKRGADFLRKWLANNIPTARGSDILSVAELTQQLFADARSLKISSTQIDEELGSVYEAILIAIKK
ncbi:DUF768 domain-containing protein [Mesorhizobium dulcispinae]|uniref:DUF768 domain-containing protein n=1 Tax=Mesorhizobium dulcispinae TaxID=3072316 RepID=UPI003F8CFEBC